MRRWFWAAVLWVPALAAAHTVAVAPVRVRLKADAGALRATVQTNALGWAELTGMDIPAGGAPWPDALRQAYLNYMQAHLPLFIDGKPLAGRVLGGRLAQPLWKSEGETELIIDVVYDFPPGQVFSGRANFFREEWEHMEGAGHGAARGVRRDFGTLLRWSPGPGGARLVSIQAPDFEMPRRTVLRSAPGRWGESAWLGARAVLEGGGGLTLLLAALLAPPALGRRAAAGLLAAFAAGVALPAAPATEVCLWLAAAIVAGAMFTGRPAAVWWAGLVPGAACAARGWAAAGVVLRDATAFSAFAWPAFWAGPLLTVVAVLAGRKVFKAFYAYHFAHLTPDELARQALFHRRMAAVLVAIAGVTRVLSPLWTVTP